MYHPCIIKYNKITQFSGKEITVNELDKSTLGFEIKRMYWINYTSPEITLSEHAHKTLNQIIICVEGEVKIKLEDKSGKLYDFLLDKPEDGLFIPANFWKKIEYRKPCILLCLASENYAENDYIRNYEEFKQLQKQ